MSYQAQVLADNYISSLHRELAKDPLRGAVSCRGQCGASDHELLWKAQATARSQTPHTDLRDRFCLFPGTSGHSLMHRAADTSDLRESLSTSAVLHPSTYKKVWCGHELTGLLEVH